MFRKLDVASWQPRARGWDERDSEHEYNEDEGFFAILALLGDLVVRRRHSGSRAVTTVSILFLNDKNHQV